MAALRRDSSTPDHLEPLLKPWGTRALGIIRPPLTAWVEDAARRRWGAGWDFELAALADSIVTERKNVGSPLNDESVLLKLIARSGNPLRASNRLRTEANTLIKDRNAVSHDGISLSDLDGMLQAGVELMRASGGPAAADAADRLEGLIASAEWLKALPFSLTEDRAATLFVVPCSAHKLDGGRPMDAGQPTDSIAESMPSTTYRRIAQSREELRERARVDDRVLRPAYARYSEGSLWRFSPKPGDWSTRLEGSHVLILSGAYGVVRWDDEIGWYDLDLENAGWPEGVLEDALIAYARAHRIRQVIAFGSATRGRYTEVLRAIPWRTADVKRATLVEPGTFEGDYADSDRPIGHALWHLLGGGTIDVKWTADTGVHLSFEERLPTTQAGRR